MTSREGVDGAAISNKNPSTVPKSQPWKAMVDHIPSKKSDAADDTVLRLRTEEDQHNGLGG